MEVSPHHGKANCKGAGLQAQGMAELCFDSFNESAPSDLQCACTEDGRPHLCVHGVPTMYNYLLSKLEEMGQEDQARAREAAARLRLTVSGSAACPVPIMKRWEQISGKTRAHNPHQHVMSAFRAA